MIHFSKTVTRQLPFLKLTATTPENRWLEHDPFLLGRLGPFSKLLLLLSGAKVAKFIPNSNGNESDPKRIHFKFENPNPIGSMYVIYLPTIGWFFMVNCRSIYQSHGSKWKLLEGFATQKKFHMMMTGVKILFKWRCHKPRFFTLPPPANWTYIGVFLRDKSFKKIVKFTVFYPFWNVYCIRPALGWVAAASPYIPMFKASPDLKAFCRRSLWWSCRFGLLFRRRRKNCCSRGGV